MKQPNIIGSLSIAEHFECNDVIDYFENNVCLHSPGITNNGINHEIKHTTDIGIYPNELHLPQNIIFKNYIDQLFKCYKNYLDQWPAVKDIADEIRIPPFNVQRYRAGGHFKKIHCERGAIQPNRVLAFMTYLNNVQAGGSTYFPYYDLEIQPKKGKTLIWPAEWTHANRGNIVEAGSKYIITGWMTFLI